LLTGVAETEDETIPKEERGRLCTIHQAKGMEWQVVFLVWCADA
jgi:superfamily I DNA/RNA helicase